ncbi:porin family protein [uncultured Tenacibaculum sp.]|uniref:porin family protein n=1 Tax=uncultured Tenacibaculum sp. TaxID=174713 RepID=UPI002611C09D|nr:porin family protein [uncultured Tenacibaculum sp.]
MKKGLLLIAMLAITLSASAQKFGVKGGLNFSKVKVNTLGVSAFAEGKTGFYLGGLVDFKLSEKFHVQPEVLFSLEGSDNLDFTFVNIPVLAKYYVTEKLNIQAGPHFGFILDSDANTDSLKTLNLGVDVGLAYELDNGLFFDVRYNHGISNLVKDGVGTEFYERAYQLGLGYRF